eukprot:14769334-Heterocapsa_arctica.AAC.1
MEHNSPAQTCRDHNLTLSTCLNTTLALLKGWQGVWEPAKVTGTYQDGVTGRSGGVVILTCNGILIFNNI